MVLPTYGRPQFRAEAIASVLAQTVDDFECIVVDDASPEPVEVPRDPRVRLVKRRTNGGPAAARNTGLAHASGRYVTFLDDDDVYTPERLRLGLEGIHKASISICWLGPLGGVRRTRLARRYLKNENRLLEGNVHDYILEGLPPHLGQVTIRRAAMPPFREKYSPAEDIEWWIRASERMSLATVPRIGYLLRQHFGPRLNYRHEVRVRTNLLILHDYAHYFASHPRAAARRWKVQARFARRLGDRATAWAALRHSFKLHPTASTLWHLIRELTH